MKAGDPYGAYLLLPVAVALAERQRRYAAETLHDGPMQEFTAVILGLGQLRHRMDDADAHRLTELETRLRDTVAALRAPASVWRSDLAPPVLLDQALRSWVEGPLADRLDLTVRGAPLDRPDVAGIVGLVQLVLHEMDPTTPVRTAAVTVEGLPTSVLIRVRAVPDPRHELYEHPDDTTATRMCDLVAALDAEQDREVDGSWVVRLRLPRHSAATAGRAPTGRARTSRLWAAHLAARIRAARLRAARSRVARGRAARGRSGARVPADRLPAALVPAARIGRRLRERLGLCRRAE